MVGLLPFIEQNALYVRISGDNFGPSPWRDWYEPWQETIPMLHCPSDRVPAPGTVADFYGTANLGTSQYHFSMGDWTPIETITPEDGDPRGIFGFRTHIGVQDIHDGTSNTIAMSERAFSQVSNHKIGNLATGFSVNMLRDNPASCYGSLDASGQYYATGTSRRSNRSWAQGNPVFAGFNTILPPNGPSCVPTTFPTHGGLFTATSRHPGGVNVLMADGSARFFSETINAGDPTHPTVNYGQSPYGVWGALGSKSGGEPLGDF